MCQAGARGTPALAGLRSAVFFEGPLQKAVHQFKYRRDIALADTLAELMLAAAPAPAAAGSLVVPVPLAADRLAARGYNQSGLLAQTYAEWRGLRLAPRGALRVRATAPQVGLSARQRRENVAGAFAGEKRLVTGRTVILIDDVCTTGATLDSCAEALLAAGATAVWGVTLARARWAGVQAGNPLNSAGAVV
jgi:ComF family protein